MDEQTRKQLLDYVEYLGNLNIDTLRSIVATGIEGRYSRRDSFNELGDFARNRGWLIRAAVEDRFFSDEGGAK